MSCKVHLSSFWQGFFLLLFFSPADDTGTPRSKKTPASERGPKAQSGIFLSTHEPCCMCISSILWTGFQRIFYFLPYETTTAQGIPHDINTMHELWGVDTYRKIASKTSTFPLLVFGALLRIWKKVMRREIYKNRPSAFFSVTTSCPRNTTRRRQIISAILWF